MKNVPTSRALALANEILCLLGKQHRDGDGVCSFCQNTFSVIQCSRHGYRFNICSRCRSSLHWVRGEVTDYSKPQAETVSDFLFAEWMAKRILKISNRLDAPPTRRAMNA